MQLKKIKHNLMAFTLIELIVVVSLLGIMAIFVIPNYNRTVDRANERAGSNNLMILYANEKMKFSSLGAYVACPNDATLTSQLSFTPLADGFTYRCSITAGPPFKCTAAGAAYTLMITDAQASVCCDTLGLCPTVADKRGSGLCP